MDFLSNKRSEFLEILALRYLAGSIPPFIKRPSVSSSLAPPHGGSDPVTPWVPIMRFVGAPDGFITGRLLPTCTRLDELNRTFADMCHEKQWQVYSFQGDDSVADQASSCLGDPTLGTKVYASGNHDEMCRFSGLLDPEYVKVSNAIMSIVATIDKQKTISVSIPSSLPEMHTQSDRKSQLANPSRVAENATGTHDVLPDMHWVSDLAVEWQSVGALRHLVKYDHHTVEMKKSAKSTTGEMLCRSAERGDKAVLQKLLDAGVDINYESENMTPLTAAIMHNHVDIVCTLLDKGADPEFSAEHGRTPLIQAAKGGWDTIVHLLLEQGVAVDGKSFRRTTTALSEAALHGHESAARLLADRGANIEFTNPEGQTPLTLAIQGRHEGLVRMLLFMGADTEQRDNRNTTPLMYAIRTFNTASVEILVSFGANLEVRDPYKGTPPMIAAETGHLAAVKILLDAGADVKARDAYGSTALICAAEMCRQGENERARVDSMEIMQLLVDAGVDVEAKDNMGRTAWDCAVRGGVGIRPLTSQEGIKLGQLIGPRVEE